MGARRPLVRRQSSWWQRSLWASCLLQQLCATAFQPPPSAPPARVLVESPERCPWPSARPWAVRALPSQRESRPPGLAREDLLLLLPGALGLGTGVILLRAGLAEDQLYEAKHKQVFSVLQGGVTDVLEIGIGDGANFKYYPRGIRLTGLDPGLSPQGARGMEGKARNRGLDLTLVKGGAESLPMADGSFDAVVSTLVLCSVADPAQVLREVHRVLRPGGRYCFIEHVKAPEGTALAAQQELFDPLQQLLANGCHLTRQNDRLLMMAAAQDAREAADGLPHFQSLSGFEYLNLGSRWPVARQVVGVLTK